MEEVVSGVYVIENLHNNKQYVGSSVNLRKRYREHLHALRTNKHHSLHLQYAFNSYGEQCFDFIVIELCEIPLLLEREQYYIDTLKLEYNVSLIAGNTLGTKRSEETKKRLSESHVGQVAWNKGIPKSEEEKLAHSRKMKGKPSGNAKKVYEWDAFGNILAEYSSVTALAASLGSPNSVPNITNAIKRKRKFKNKLFTYEK